VSIWNSTGYEAGSIAHLNVARSGHNNTNYAMRPNIQNADAHTTALNMLFVVADLSRNHARYAGVLIHTPIIAHTTCHLRWSGFVPFITTTNIGNFNVNAINSL
jgi:hypothetical protein